MAKLHGNVERTIASNPATGKPYAIARGLGNLNARQKTVLQRLPTLASGIVVKKTSFGQRDLAALTAATGEEFAMFSLAAYRLIVRGDKTSVPITPTIAKELARRGWKWSAHTHPGTDPTVLRASLGDVIILDVMQGRRSAILNSIGQRAVFTLAGASLSGWLPWP